MPLLRTFFWVRGWTALADVLAGYWLLRFVTGEAGDLLRLPMLAVPPSRSRGPGPPGATCWTPTMATVRPCRTARRRRGRFSRRRG